MLEFRKAVRRSVPMLLSLSGVSGSGKTYSSLLLAAGIAGPNGRVGFLDTENGRGEMYVDSPGILKALPKGYDYARLDPPFEPKNYTAAIEAAEQAGITVLVIDSGSHEWEGIGGACEIAEKNAFGRGAKKTPNWALAKREHKRFLYRCLASSMNIIFCLRAREKVKFVKKTESGYQQTDDEQGATNVIPLGIQPICEKGFVHEMLVSLRIEEETHFAVPLKVPEPLLSLFPQGRKLTAEDGARIREWNDTGSAQDPVEVLVKQARAEAEHGLAHYQAWFSALKSPHKRTFAARPEHEENKRLAQEADTQQGDQERQEFADFREALGDEDYFRVLGAHGLDQDTLWMQAEARERCRKELLALAGVEA